MKEEGGGGAHREKVWQQTHLFPQQEKQTYSGSTKKTPSHVSLSYITNPGCRGPEKQYLALLTSIVEAAKEKEVGSICWVNYNIKLSCFQPGILD